MFFEFETSNQPKDSSKSLTNLTTKKSPISPLAIDSSTSLLTNHISSLPIRHRRYSMHSFVATGQQQQQPNTLGTLRENIPTSSNCDLALITKKKLMLLSANGSSSASSSCISNGPFSTKLKSTEEGFIEPDVKLNQTFTKRSNSDLRKEVLLASIQRSLSASSEDLFVMNKSLNYESSMNETTTDSSDDDPMDVRDRYSDCQPQTTSMMMMNTDRTLESSSTSVAIPMSINNQNSTPGGRHSSQAIYMPSETQINRKIHFFI